MKKNLLVLFLPLLFTSQLRAQAPELVIDLNSGKSSGSDPAFLTVHGDALYFLADIRRESGISHYALFRHDGVNTDMTGYSSYSDPYLLPDIQPHVNHEFRYSRPLTIAGNNIFLTGISGVYGYNGSGAFQIAKANTGDNLHTGQVGYAVALGDLVYSNQHGGFDVIWMNEPAVWSYNPTSRVVTPYTSPDIRYVTSPMYIYKDKLTFSASDYNGVANLYSFTPGSGTFTRLSNFTASYMDIDYIYVDGDNVYFGAEVGAEGMELHVYNGSTVQKLTSLNSLNDGIDGAPIRYRDAIYFAGNNGTSGYELMKVNLADNTVSLVMDIEPGVGNSYPDNFTVYNGKLYFAAYTSQYGDELWEHDGVNTKMVADLNPGPDGSGPSGGTIYKGSLYFNATNDQSGYELFKYTAAASDVPETTAKDYGIKIYPNPVSDFLHIDNPGNVPDLKVSLTDVTGKLMYTTTLGAGINHCSLTNLTPGMYIVKIIGSNNEIAYSQRVVKVE